MRLHLKIQSNGQVVPFNHQHKLVGTIHKWLGLNNQHGKVSLFSFSWLTGGKKHQDGLLFQNGSSFFFSAFDTDVIKKMISGIQKDPSLFNGLFVAEIIIQEDPNLSETVNFQVASPILIKRRVGDRIDHILYDDPKAGEYLKETLQTRMKEVGLVDDSLEIHFDSSSPYAKRKNLVYNNVNNICSWCPVVITAKPETKLFAWNVGLGNSTGIGLGALRY
ncbi:MAG: CRISPR-associated endoribonuclease Cas6 [Bacteroidales bacterium]